MSELRSAIPPQATTSCKGDAVLDEVLDDPTRPEGHRFEERPVDLGRGGREREAGDDPRQVGVTEDRPIAVPPVEGDEPARARLDGRRLPLDPGEPALARIAVGETEQVVPEPAEHVPHGRLPCLVAEVSREDPVLDDAGDPRHLDLASVDDEVADRRADDHHEHARPLDAGAGDGHERVDVADRHGDVRAEPEPRRHLGPQATRPPAGRGEARPELVPRVRETGVGGLEVPRRRQAVVRPTSTPCTRRCSLRARACP